MKKLWLIALLILATECSFGQQDYEIAEQYFRNGQFTEAKMYYEKLNKEGFENEIFENYKSTLIQLDLEKEAETLKVDVMPYQSSLTSSSASLQQLCR